MAYGKESYGLREGIVWLKARNRMAEKARHLARNAGRLASQSVFLAKEAAHGATDYRAKARRWRDD